MISFVIVSLCKMCCSGCKVLLLALVFDGSVFARGDGNKCFESAHVIVGSRCHWGRAPLRGLHAVASLHHVYWRSLTGYVDIAVEARVCSDGLGLALVLSLKSSLFIGQRGV